RSITPRRKPSKGALIQIHFVYENHPSIIILIEALYLPDESSPTFGKIRKLYRTIFSNKHCIFAWGDVEKKLSKFYQYNLFDEDDIKQLIPKHKTSLKNGIMKIIHHHPICESKPTKHIPYKWLFI
ncbi:unnamed protein product, partial [Rotaria magnacalcarata]